MNRLAPAWRLFSPPSALRATSGETLLKPAQVVLANAGGLVSGQWNSERGSWATLFHYFKSRITSVADQRLGANLVDPHPRGNSHDSAGAGKMWRGTAGNGQGARFAHGGQTGSVQTRHVNLLTPQEQKGRARAARLGWGEV